MMNDAIGGYFSLELNEVQAYHKTPDCIPLNTARNCLEYILEVNDYKVVYVPYFTCEVILEPFSKLDIEYRFYSIDERLEPVFDFELLSNKEAFLYTNYFGLKDNFVEKMGSMNINLIVDNSQSFFSSPIKGVDTFYSARKFIGVADGAYLYTDRELSRELETDLSFERMGHLLKRVDTKAEEGYVLFLENDNGLVNQPIKRMSKLTQSILSSVDYEFVKMQRRQNFLFLHDKLKYSNLFVLDLIEDQVPMVYPYRTNDSELKKRLQEKRIYCASYWPNVKEWCAPDSLEYKLVDEVVYLPIDQRYDLGHMEIIVKEVLR